MVLRYFVSDQLLQSDLGVQNYCKFYLLQNIHRDNWEVKFPHTLNNRVWSGCFVYEICSDLTNLVSESYFETVLR